NSTDTGVPGFSQALRADPPVPAWNLTHWRVVYRTAYYNPFPDPSNHTGAWQAMNYDQAQRMQAAIQAGTIKGVVDLSTQWTDANGDGVPDWMISQDFHVASHTAQGTVFFDLNRDGSFGAMDVSAPGATVTLTHALFAFTRTVTSASDGTYSVSDLPEGSYRVSIGLDGRTIPASPLTIAQTDLTQGIAVPYAAVRGFTVSSDGGAVSSAQMQFLDQTNSTTISVTPTSDGSFQVRQLLG